MMLFACELKVHTNLKNICFLKYLHTCGGCGRGDPAGALNELQTADKKPRRVYEFIWAFKTKTTAAQIEQIIFHTMPALQLIL